MKQPPYDPAKPNQMLSDEFRAVLSWPDEQVTATLSQSEPPVKVEPAAKPAATRADDARG